MNEQDVVLRPSMPEFVNFGKYIKTVEDRNLSIVLVSSEFLGYEIFFNVIFGLLLNCILPY